MTKFLVLISLLFAAVAAKADPMATDTIWTKYFGTIVQGVTFSPDGQYVYAAAEGMKPMKLSSETGELIREYEGMYYASSGYYQYFIHTSKDGSLLYGADTSKYVYVWNAESGELVTQYDPDMDGEHIQYYRSMDVGEQYLAAFIVYGAFPYHGKIVVWDILSHEIVYEEKSDAVNRLKISPDGRYLTKTTSGGLIIIQELGTWEEYYRFSLPSGQSAIDISFSPDGSKLASCGWDGYIRIWDVNEKSLVKEIIEPGISSKLYAIDIFDKDFLLCNGYNDNKSYVKIWDYKNGTLHSQIRTSLAWNISSNNNLKKACLALSRNLLLVDLSNLVSSVEGKIAKVNNILPNPNTSISTINITLSSPENIEIKIVNQEGIEIESIFSGILEAGEHNFTWNGSNYPSGVYYARITGKSINQTMKIVKVK